MLDNQIKLSVIIPVKTERSQALRELVQNLEAQDFPKQNLEILPITEGTSESAKAIGIRRAKGDVICIMASDNLIPAESIKMFSEGHKWAMKHGSAYAGAYYHSNKMSFLDRYFALIGGNDPLSYYMGKNDRISYIQMQSKTHEEMSFGDNCFFIRKDIIEKSDLDNYYHVDNVYDVKDLTLPYAMPLVVIHRSGSIGILRFMAKRYRYGLQHAFNPSRRWHLVDFSKPKDIWRLAWFIIASVSLIPTLCLSIRGFLKIPDVAWFLHPIVCLATVFTYGILMAHVCARTMFRSLFAPMAAQRA